MRSRVVIEKDYLRAEILGGKGDVGRGVFMGGVLVSVLEEAL